MSDSYVYVDGDHDAMGSRSETGNGSGSGRLFSPTSAEDSSFKFSAPEPIAIIGTACHFPGSIDSPQELAEFLKNPRDVLGDTMPSSRANLARFQHENPNHHGSTNVIRAYMLLQRDPAQFDSAFFHMHASEAEATDPQHRMILETVYEALESAGYPLSAVSGSRTGVYVGCMSSDYYDMQMLDVETMPKYTGIGTSRSMLSNRVSYFFNLKGPSMTIDTACSSSLVGVDAAVRSLRDGTSEMAIVAGANLILTPHFFVEGGMLGFLSPTSRCRMWDAAADGYARGEGVGAVVLKPLAKALADGDHVESVIKATGTNSDGHTNNITMPSAVVQAELIRSTYRSAGLDPESPLDRPQYYEAHGTGTRTGDPLEAEGISRGFFGLQDYGGGRADDPEHNETPAMYVGSIKTLIGHLETCAGLAGLLKASIAVQHGFIPPNLLFNEMNPEVAPFARRLKLATQLRPWPETHGERPRRASVGSYGFGGTNAHVVLESHDSAGDAARRSHRHKYDDDCTVMPLVGPFVLSAASRFSLVAGVSHLAQHIAQNPQEDLDDVAWTLAHRRSILPYRISFPGAASPAELVDKLQASVDRLKKTQSLSSFGTETQTPLTTGPSNWDQDLTDSACVLDERAAILAIFTGQGAQWPGMGRELLQWNARFQATIAACDEVLRGLPEAHRPSWSIKGEMLKPPDTSDSQLGRAEIASPVTTALQLGLADLLRASGVRFAAVVGHSSGETAALYAAGILELEDCIKIAYYKGFSGRHSTREGAMLAVGLSYDQAQELCSQPQFAGRIGVAASNGPTSVTISGDADAIAEAKETLDGEGTFARALRVDRAYHSNHTTEVLPFLRKYLEGCNIAVGCSPRAASESTDLDDNESPVWISTLYGNSDLMSVNYEEIKCEYWLKSATDAVLFSQAVEASLVHGPFDLIMEIGPHAALQGPTIQTITAALASSPPYTSVLKRGKNAIETFSSSLGHIWEHVGRPLDIVQLDLYQRTFRSVNRDNSGRDCTRSVVKGLPAYQWDRQRHWHESRMAANLRLRGGPPPNELLGRRCPDDSDSVMRWRNLLCLEELPWLQGHAFQGGAVFPMAGYAAVALEAALAMAGTRNNKTGPDLLHEIAEMRVEDLLVHEALSLDSCGKFETLVTLAEKTATPSRARANEHTPKYGTLVADLTFEGCALTDDSRVPELSRYCSARVVVSFVSDGQNDVNDVYSSLSSSPYVCLCPKRHSQRAKGLPLDVAEFYAHLTRIGIQYDGPFRAITQGNREEGSQTASASCVWDNPVDQVGGFTLLHPAVLDNSLQAIIAALYPPGSTRFGSPLLPVRMGRLAVNPRRLGAFTRRCNAVHRDSSSSDEACGSVGTVSVATYRGPRASPLASVSTQVLLDVDAKLAHVVQDDQTAAFCADGIAFSGVLGELSTPRNDLSLFYHTVMEPDILSPNFDFLPAQDDSAQYYTNIETLERLTLCYIRHFVDGVSVSQQANFPKWHHRHMTSVFRQRLFAHGQQQQQQQQQRQHRREKDQDDNVEALLAELEAQNVVNARLVRAVGENLRAVCEGRRDMLEVLLEQDDALSTLYDRGIAMTDGNRAVAQMVGLIAHRYPRMEFLEVGGGTGGTTKYVLEALGGRFKTYTFTDISAGFFKRSEEKLSKFDDGHGGKIKYRVFDIERSPTSQGFAEGAYDLIMAANCVHATKSLGATLAHIRALLRPGGFLVLLDITGDPIWLSYSFVFGGLDQWWAGAEDGRVDGPGASRARWNSELLKSGFSGLDQAVAFPERREMFSVMLSQAVDEPGTVLALRQPTLALERDSSRLSRQAFAVVGASSLAGHVVSQFGRNGPKVTHVPSLGHVGAATDPASSSLFAPGKNLAVVLMTELDVPLFSHLTSDALACFKRLLRSSRYFMLVTRRCGDENPHSNMLVGVLRALFVEMPQVRFECIDIGNSDVLADNLGRTSNIISVNLLRMVLMPLLKEEPSFDDNTMWSIEPELLVRDGCVQVPRVVKDKARNGRLNSSKRLIEQETYRSQHLVELDAAQDEPWKPYIEKGDGGRPPPAPPPQVLVRRPLLPRLPADRAASIFQIETTFSTVHYLPCAPGQQRFHLVLGTVECHPSVSPTTRSRVAALCPANPATTLDMPRDNVFEFQRKDMLSLSLFPDDVILLAILSNIVLRRTALLVTEDGKVLLLNPGRDLSNMMPKLNLPRVITDRVLLAGVGVSSLTETQWQSIGAVVDMGGGLHVAGARSRENDRDGEQMLEGIGPWVLRYRYPFIPAVSESQNRSIFFSACADLASLDLSASTACLSSSPASLFDWRSSKFKTQVQPLDYKTLFRADRTYLLVGLSSDLGLSLCRWMVANGARHVAIASRHAPEQIGSDLYLSLVNDMHRAGAYLTVIRCDATKRASLKAAVRELTVHPHMPPIAGVAHGAMVLEDKLFADMTVSDLEKVIAPKALGATHLDELFSDVGGKEPLDFFVMMSSTACVIGNISQSNYHAGNMFMAALARRRRARGLPASVLHLSAVVGVGYVHRLPGRAREITNTFAMLHEEDLHLAFGEAVAAGWPGSGADCEVICTLKTKSKNEKKKTGGVGTAAGGKDAATATVNNWLDSPRFSALVENDGPESDAGADGNGSAAAATVKVTDLGAALRAVPASDQAQAAQLIHASFVRKLENALRKGAGTIDVQASMSAVGLDSVLAVEMRFWFLKAIMVEIPVLKIMNQSVSQISEHAASEYMAQREAK
ncbi:pks-nrps protein [Colletotrichum incanum]|uniref:Pks-nrps protein n=1 Tax=Colletotrichum incanum TaxID=1573173 RepID=A0A166PS92_COLIC|nr:pks-nrps protein [Colletotrichum incanum]OHW95341.1 PKS-NRPS protein [Colletotrichum incanum]